MNNNTQINREATAQSSAPKANHTQCTILRPATREEWLELRKHGIGSSEVAAILGLSPWCTPYQLWMIKKGLAEPKEETFAMRAGLYLEDAVSRFFSDATGHTIIKASGSNWIAIDPERPYLRVSPDRTYWLCDAKHNRTGKGICECKTTQLKVDADCLPPHWLCQLQYQLGVTGLQHGALAWLSQGRDFGYREVDFDPAYFEWMATEVTNFWHRFIEGNEVPDVTDVADVLLRNPRHTDGKVLVADDEMLDAVKTINRIKPRISTLDSRKKDAEAAIKKRMGDAEVLMPKEGGKPLATWRTGKDRVSFNSKRFALDHPDLYEAYKVVKPGPRTFLVK